MKNLRLDKKQGKTLMSIILVMLKNKPEDWCVNSVNPLYLMINKIFCFAGEKNGVKYLKIDKGNKKLEDYVLSLWNEVFTGIRYYIKKINYECKELSKIKVYYDEDFVKINFFSNDNLPIGKLNYFPTITVTIRFVLKQGDLFYPLVDLDDVLYQL